MTRRKARGRARRRIESNHKIKETTYFVKGMHCASCEILIEKKLLNLRGVESVEASLGKGKVLIEYEGKQLPIGKLNKIFEKDGYAFSNQPFKTSNASKANEVLIVLGASLLIVAGFIILNKLGLSGIVNVSSRSSLPMFFTFGLLAGISSCAALVGGIVLSVSKQWLKLYSDKDSTFRKLEPHFAFSTGRLISFALLGAVLGSIGRALQLSLKFTAILVFAVSVMMIFLALQMLGVGPLQKFQFTAPKFITRYASDESNFKGRWMPSMMGALTFFLPCGFTITAQSLALLSGNALQGSLIMLFFALGTLPMLIFIGLSSVKFFEKKHLSDRFLKIAGVLVLFFALYNINNQLNVLGLSSLSDASLKPFQASQTKAEDLPPIVNGKQVLKMNAMVYSYEPNYLRVRAGIPVRWEITDRGTSGCTNAIISPSLFEGQIVLTPGKTSVIEFTPTRPGRYKFSCWMGMVSGVIEVVDPKNPNAVPEYDETKGTGGKGSCPCCSGQ